MAPFGGRTPLADAHAEAGTLPEIDRYSPAGDGTGCHAVVRTNAEGKFVVDTVEPGAYGPPQHLELRVTEAAGFAPLYTKVYFADDPHLAYIAHTNIHSLKRDHRVVEPVAGPTPRNVTRRYGDALSVVELGDLQNRTLSFNATLADAPAVATDWSGTFRRAEMSVVTSRDDAAAFDVDHPSRPGARSGTWSDGRGLVEIVSNGNRFVAAERPSPRSWGAVAATHAGRFGLEKANFRGGVVATASLAPARGPNDGDVLTWSHGEIWRRSERAAVKRYRYLRLVINETLRSRNGKLVEVDDVEVYGGVLDRGGARAETAPLVGLKGRAIPRPMRCWATTESEDCYKAFDKVLGQPWRSAAVGGWGGRLSRPQTLTIDLGAALALSPTALRVRCGAAHGSAYVVGALDCPRFFSLEGAVDGEDPLTGHYDSLLTHRVPVVRDAAPRAYGAAGGLLVEFAAATHFTGRPAGERCGSCFAPAGCAAGAPDRTCASAYRERSANQRESRRRP